jgi:hypothetical protein
VRVQTPLPDEFHSPSGDFHVMNGRITAKVFPSYDAAAAYAHGLVTYIERHEDADLEI